MIFSNKAKLYIISCFAFLILLFVIKQIFTNSPDKQFIKFQKEFREKSLDFKKEFIKLLNDTPNKKNYQSLDNVSFNIYEFDTLTFWSKNNIPLPIIYDTSIIKNNISFIGNGWYYILKEIKGNNKYIGTLKLKNEYPYQNSFLENTFLFNNAEKNGEEIVFDKSKYSIYDEDGKYLFSVKYLTSLEMSNSMLNIIAFLSIIFIMILIISLFHIYKCINIFKKHPLLLIIIFVFNILLLRILQFELFFPAILFKSQIFSPEYFAMSSIVPSLGDLMINALILSFFGLIFFTHFKISDYTFNRKIKYIIAFLLLFVTTAMFYFLQNGIEVLIKNASFSISLNNIFSLSYESVIAIFIIATFLITYVLVAHKAIQISIELIKKHTHILLLQTIMLSIVLLLIFFGKNYFDWLYVFYIIFFAMSYKFITTPPHLFSIKTASFYTILFAMFSSVVLYQQNREAEIAKLKDLILNISQERDPIAEYDLLQASLKIMKDTNISKIIFQKQDINIDQYLGNKYFKGYLKKYNFQITICQKNQKLLVKPEYLNIDCNEYFDDKIKSVGEKVFGDSVYYLNYGYGNPSYLVKLKLKDTANNMGSNMFLEFDQKSVTNEMGYPELLIDKNLALSNDISGYSYAYYENNNLIKKYGKYSYSSVFGHKQKLKDDFEFFDAEDYNHIIYNVSDDKIYIISKKQDDFFSLISPFSYLLVFYTLYLIIFYTFIRGPKKIKILSVSYGARLQMSIASILLISFLLIGAASIIYIYKLNKNKNVDLLSERTQSILLELQNKIGDQEVIDESIKDKLENILIKFSNIFFTDINMYNTKGTLIATSRPEIFSEQLTSKQINPTAFNELKNNKKIQWMQTESIGKLQYLSSYVPFENYYGKTIGYLNLPYFAKQNLIKKEISGFLVAYTNLYILLIGLTFLVTIIISNYITRPLQLIRNKLSAVNLGKPNEKIYWKSKDEIGELINEYNRMIEELQQSAEKLALSERESAWREMAKQVAHEIKNPLTPMKLSTQHLEKAWNDKTNDWEVRLKKYTKTMIEQIDTLTEIASAFSDFAKMPKSQAEKININDAIIDIIDLYKNTNNIDYKEKSLNKTNLNILVDRRQFSRALNNIVRNATEAVSEIKDSIIIIKSFEDKDNIVISVSDNGVGISESEKKNIFIPNFTTKTTGTGLGLAITKNIINDAGGKIWFESTMGKGTTFYISFPIV